MPRFRLCARTTPNTTSTIVDIFATLNWLIASNTTQYGPSTPPWTLDQVQWGWEIVELQY
jgi:hypothetical protein